MKPSKNWLQRLLFRDRRSAGRCSLPPLIAHYWTGDPPSGQCIRDISLTGLFVQTEPNWYPGTIVRITLQRTDGTVEDREDCTTVQAMAVRLETDGVGFAFVMPPITKRRRHAENVDLVANRESLKRFVNKLKQGNLEARFGPWID
jgi:hypothetical protein